MPLTLRSAAALAVAVALTAAPLAAGKRDGLERLAGVWQLDARASDDPLAELRRPVETEERPLREDRREGRRRTRSRTWVFPRVDREAVRRDLRDRVERLLRDDQVLTIAVDGPQVTIVDWNDRRDSWEVGGGKERRSGDDGVEIVVAASWKSSDRLFIKMTGVPGGDVVRIFEPGGRGETLFVTARLDVRGSSLPFEFTRVYHRLSGGREE